MNYNSKYIAFTILIAITNVKVIAQPCSNGISTNPNNPVNNQFVPLMNTWYPESQYPGTGTDTENPFLNTHFNWYLDAGTIYLYPGMNSWDHQWSGNPDSVPMLNPYSGSMGSEFAYLRPDSVAASNRDFRWEDGWELLWMNMGYYPDGSSIGSPSPGSFYSNHHQDYAPLPSDIPYFILYNRYRGLMRVIANVWYDNANYQNVEVVLKFPGIDIEEGNLTGILRHASAIDLPLDQRTEIFSIHSPRYRIPSLTQWMVADFQIGYDPCTCISRGELQLEFIAFNSMDIDIVGRSISVDQPITESDYTTSNFLNLSNIDPVNYQSGTEIYPRMKNLYNNYQRNLEVYSQNLDEYNDYNKWHNKILRTGIKLVGEYLTGAVSDIVINDSLLTWLYKESSDTTQILIHISETDTTKLKKKLTDKTKKELLEMFDFFTGQIFAPKPNKPRKPTIPVASYEESVYKGTISRIDSAATSPLYIPGTIPSGYGGAAQSVPPFKYPAYNEVLGMVALLNTPKAIAKYKYWGDNPVWWTGGILPGDECFWKQNFILENSFSLRLTDNLNLAFNPALDFDFTKTKTYVSIEVVLQNDAWIKYSPVVQFGSNLHLVNAFPEQTNHKIINTVYQSDWIDYSLVNQMVFNLNNLDTLTRLEIGYYDGSVCSYSEYPSFDEIKSRIQSIKLKIMNDMYFDQVGTNEEQVNTTQVFSYMLFDRENQINLLENLYLPPNEPSVAVFEKYIPGVISFDETNNTIWPGHPFISEVDPGGILYIDAEKVNISANLNIASGYSLVIRALDKIRMQPGSQLNPNVHLQIRSNYYSTPAFEYADNTYIHNFCTDTSQYHANAAAKSLFTGIRNNNELNSQSMENGTNSEKNHVIIHPNPANSQIQITSSSKPITEIEIFDLSGRSLIHQKTGAEINTIAVNVAALQSGVYIVQTLCGDQRSTEKLVISK